MCLTCDLTVPSEMISRAAMPALVSPVAMSRRTSISRRVKAESAGEWSAANIAAPLRASGTLSRPVRATSTSASTSSSVTLVMSMVIRPTVARRAWSRSDSTVR